MKRLLLALLLFPAMLQAQTITHRYFHTDQHMSTPIALGTAGSATDAIKAMYLSDGTDKWSLVPGVNKLEITAGTSDAADDQQFMVTGGGASGATRGATLHLFGNEAAGNTGNAYLIGGATGAIYFRSGSAGADRWSITNDGNLTQDATNGGNIVMAKAATGIIAGAASLPAAWSAAVGTGHFESIFTTGTTAAISAYNTAVGAGGARIALGKGRSGTTTVGLKPDAGDFVGQIDFFADDGDSWERGARIHAIIDGTAGASDVPMALIFSTAPDGSATVAEAMRISQDKKVTIAAGIVSSATDVGWVVRAGADTACTTTCGANKGCLFGIDAGASAVVACATATADTCLCSQ